MRTVAAVLVLFAAAISPAADKQAELGRKLFFDPILSADGSMSCAGCHNPAKGYSSGGLPVGRDNRPLRRKPPTLFDVGKRKALFWDGRAATLEAQCLEPIENPVEMASNLLDVSDRLNDKYSLDFHAAFPRERRPVSVANMAKALASFERTIERPGRFDKFLDGEPNAYTASETRGWNVFRGKALCYKCHVGRNLTDDDFHVTGVGFKVFGPADFPNGKLDIKKQAALVDAGRFEVTKNLNDSYKFKTPTLRGCKLTAPYMHDCSIETLEGVVEFYNRGGRQEAPGLDKSLIRPLGLTGQEKSDLVAFLKSL